jgi:hypothetical protein
MELLFTPHMLRIWRFSKRLSIASMSKLIGTRLTLRAGPDGFDDLLRDLERDVGSVISCDDAARGLALATLQKYDFADFRATVEASALSRHSAECGVKALRELGLLTPPPSTGVDDQREWAEEIFDMYEDGLTFDAAYLHVFARARRSWWTRAMKGKNIRGLLPATLIVERAYISNCSLAPWAFSYL